AVDKANVTIGLREIAQHAASQRIELLREQADVIAAGEQAGKELARFRIAALQDVVVDEPEAAREEGPLACGQPVGGVFGFVAQDEFAIDQESLLNRSKGSADPRVLGGKKADQRDQQETGVELFGTVSLHKAVEVSVETTFTNFGMNFVGEVAPSPSRL